jgi:flagellar biosynthesis/type III secretory pathway protein FliH
MSGARENYERGMNNGYERGMNNGYESISEDGVHSQKNSFRTTSKLNSTELGNHGNLKQPRMSTM